MREMKESGVQWIGRIPGEWEICKVKQHYVMQTGFTPDTKNETYYDDNNGFVWVTISDIIDGQTIVDTKKKVSLEYLKEFSPAITPAGSLLYSFKLSVGQTAFAGIDLYTNEAIASFLATANVDLQFMHYSSSLIIMNAQTNIYGARLLNQELIRNALIIFPPLCEQAKIATHLNNKCAQIDALISNVQAQMEQLKQYKQSLITEVVTKGIDPDVPMKDSGVQWIGEIPQSSSIVRMRYLIADYKTGPFGSALITDQLLSSGNILCYTPEHIANQSAENEKNLYLPESRREEMEQFFVRAGDVIFPIVGSLGRAMIVRSDMPEGIINQRLAKFQVLTDKIDIQYFMWLFAKSSFFAPFIALYQRGSIIVNLTKTIVYDMPFVIPKSMEEQQRIVAYLDAKCAQIDRLLAIKQAKIDKLTEYKKSLIYEYVTGKKEA